MEEYLASLSNRSLIGEETPLISNLNMVENIALIKEAHENKDMQEAQAEALAVLAALGLESIAQKRVSQCNALEIFYVMFVRALMAPKKHIVLKMPLSLTESLGSICDILAKMEPFLQERGDFLEILDLEVNRAHYKRCIDAVS